MIPLSRKRLKRLYKEINVFGVEHRNKNAPVPREVLLSQMKFKNQQLTVVAMNSGPIISSGIEGFLRISSYFSSMMFRDCI